MEDMEEKLGAILNDPQMMQQIMAMAKSLGAVAPAQEPAPQAPSPGPDIDLAAIGKLTSLASQSAIDKQQQALLNALCPYLSRERVTRLEKAMRAAKLARFASAALGQGGLSSLLGR